MSATMNKARQVHHGIPAPIMNHELGQRRVLQSMPTAVSKQRTLEKEKDVIIKITPCYVTKIAVLHGATLAIQPAHESVVALSGTSYSWLFSETTHASCKTESSYPSPALNDVMQLHLLSSTVIPKLLYCKTLAALVCCNNIN